MSRMDKQRLEIFSDGVLAIIITIMILHFQTPRTPEYSALMPMMPVFLSYILSFIYVGIYWNNHHHMLQATQNVNGRILWANLHLLFWLSLVPFTTGWMGENDFAPVPVAIYGCVLFMCSLAYLILRYEILNEHGERSLLGRAVNHDLKGKISPVMYLLAVASTFYISHWVALCIYVGVALLWLYPEKEIEERMAEDAAVVPKKEPVAKRRKK